MNPIKYLIIDDEPLAREGIRIMADKFDNLLYAGECHNALQAITTLNEQVDIDLLFLDIEMPGLTGLEFLKSTQFNKQIILTTAYPQYALESYEYGVVDYLVKPVRLERFAQAITKVTSLNQVTPNDSTETTPHQVTDQDSIYVKSERTIIKLKYEDIKYISGLKDYVAIHTTNGKILTALNIKTINSQLPQHIFCRINKSYIINVSKIDRITKSDVNIGEMEIAIGETYKAEFFTNHIDDHLLKRK